MYRGRPAITPPSSPRQKTACLEKPRKILLAKEYIHLDCYTPACYYIIDGRDWQKREASMVKLVKRGDRYVAVSTYDERHIPKAAGFRWDKDERCWWTKDVATAAKLAEYAVDSAREALEAAAAERKASFQASSAVDAEIDLPVPEGLAYLPFQRAGVAYAMRRPNVLIGDEMGLGKTIQAIGLINADPTIKRVLVTVPATLRTNWARELRKWLVRPMTIGIAAGKEWPGTDVVIINYDILKNHVDALRAQEWDLLIADEAHALKNPKAQRTAYVLGKWDKDPAKRITAIPARRKAFLTGTPILNRPIELYTLIKALDPETWRNWRDFATRYCDGKQTAYGWDVSGASNLNELQERLRSTIMIRRLKKDVLTELPAKRRQIVPLPQNGAAPKVAAEWKVMRANEEALAALRARVELAKASDNEGEYKAAVHALRAGSQKAFDELSKARHETALAKLPAVLEHVRELLETGEKVVVFAHHLDVLGAITEEFGDAAVTLIGETSQEDRQLAVDRFQNDPAVKLFVGSIKAAGVGITLTASSTVVFAELDWVPGNLTQAEDRCHRIGQVNSVLVQHLVLDESIDAMMAQTIIAKQEVIDKALDAPVEGFELPALPAEEPATATVGREEIAVEAKELTDEQIGAVHEGLRLLAALDPDRASQRNEMGFNMFDGRIGHELAVLPRLSPKQAALGRRLLRKYRRQLEEGLLARIG